MNEVYSSTEEYNTEKKRKILIVFGVVTADMISNKKLHPVMT